ncbi:hypothetical protein [Nostoc punctiforme]|nr:hypothetical protein [Nostoc punctiforme]
MVLVLQLVSPLHSSPPPQDFSFVSQPDHRHRSYVRINDFNSY